MGSETAFIARPKDREAFGIRGGTGPPATPPTRRGSGALRARAKPKKTPRAPLPLEPDKVVSRVARVRRFGCRACRVAAPISDTRRDRRGGRPCAPRLGRTGIPPVAHCSILCDTPDTRHHFVVLDKGSAPGELFWRGMSGGSGACPRGASFTSGARSARAPGRRTAIVF